MSAAHDREPASLAARVHHTLQRQELPILAWKEWTGPQARARLHGERGRVVVEGDRGLAQLRTQRFGDGPVSDQRESRAIERLPHDAIFGGQTLDRSEEHTSELQSLTNLVCRLLLEKK